MRPLIAIVAHTDENRFNMPAVNIPTSYVDAVEQAGGIPFILPIVKDASLLPRMAEQARGFLFPGGYDLDPDYFNEAPLPGLGRVDRDLDEFQLAAFRLALDMEVPVLGICRGAQVINVALGGSLYQDIPSQFHTPVLRHTQEGIHTGTDHAIDIEPGSRLHRLFGKQIEVNSRHHQSIKEPGRDLVITARAPDGVVEAAEHTRLPIDLIQWHPELMMLGSPAMAPLFDTFIKRCRG
ncbi:MAG: gamma-glutamyl-gamma-aminobutyrate hydrolase family protein [Desulfobacter sp.]|nr:MAG: gamma-glutamyl-gamma-aminobutyrate hydrolase family protein [Desulfobacter sp.]